MQHLARKHHGHNLKEHMFHEVLCDYTESLNNNYSTLPQSWVNYFLVRISNLLSHVMRWRNVYPVSYNSDSMVLTVTGFPTYELKPNFKMAIQQIDYAVHKLNYQYAVLYMYGRNHVRLEFHNTPRPKDKCVYIEYLTDNTFETTTSDSNCNILTEYSTETMCSCKKHEKECE